MNDADGGTDGLLVAYLDGELDPADEAQLVHRLADDPGLRARLAALSAGQRPFREAFDLVLAGAPVRTMEAMLDGLGRSLRQAPGKSSRSRRGFFAVAASAAAAFVLGIGTGQVARPLFDPGSKLKADGEFQSHWRQRVAEYQALYTPESVASIPDDEEARRRELEVLGAKLGLGLSPEAVSLQDLIFKRAQLFGYDGHTLGQLTYLHASRQVVALCIVDDGESDTPVDFESREGMRVIYWSKARRSFMLIGTLPEAELRSLALDASRRF